MKTQETSLKQETSIEQETKKKQETIKNREAMTKREAIMKHKPIKKSLWRQIVYSRILILMCMPAVIFFIVFCYLPMPGAYIAFTDFNYKAGIFAVSLLGLIILNS